MPKSQNDILNSVSAYYSGKLAEFGLTAKGVDWNGEESQFLRFEQLLKITDKSKTFSINDLGCGYGALVDYLKINGYSFNYLGVDVADEMIAVANERNLTDSQFINADRPDRKADYSIASGIFNVKLETNDTDWLKFIENTLEVLNETSIFGFSFNCLTSYSDEDFKKDYLFYADPLYLFNLCKKRFSRNVALLHDYGLYEFTILVRKL